MINLYGSLARKFKKIYNHSPKGINIIATSARDALKGLEANFPGFTRLIQREKYYKVVRGDSIVDGKSIETQELLMNFSETNWCFMPIAAGCKSGGIAIVLGIALVAASIYFAPAAGGFAAGTFGAATNAAAVSFTAVGLKLGIGIALFGVASLLAPAPQVQAGAVSPDKKPSYLFDGPRNSVEPGIVIPPCYGEVYSGSIFISGGMEIIDELTDS